MKINQLATICSLIGMVLIAMSLVITYIIQPAQPAADSWSREEAEAYTEAAMKLHADSFDPTITDDELEESKEVYDAQRAKLDAVKQQRENLPKYVRLTGMAFVIAGVGFYIGGKANEKN